VTPYRIILSERNRLVMPAVRGTQGSSLGSKLVLVIDNHPQRTDSRRRFPVTRALGDATGARAYRL
jgi:hypothetical protein